MPRRGRRPGGQGRQLRRTCATPATRSRWPRVYGAEGADELTFLDVTRQRGDRETTYDVVRRTAEQVFIPLTVGGGVRTVDDVDRLLRAGADKVGRQHRRHRPAGADRRDRRAVRRPGAGAVGRTPGAAGTAPVTDSGFEVTTHGGRTGHRHRRRRVGARAPPSSGPARSCSTRWTPTAPRTASTSSCIGRCAPAVRRAADRQRRERARSSTSPPRCEAGADAVLAASVFHFGELTIGEVKDALREAGHTGALRPVRQLAVRSARGARPTRRSTAGAAGDLEVGHAPRPMPQSSSSSGLAPVTTVPRSAGAARRESTRRRRAGARPRPGCGGRTPWPCATASSTAPPDSRAAARAAAQPGSAPRRTSSWWMKNSMKLKASSTPAS